MRLYRVTAAGHGEATWAGSQTDVVAAKKVYMEAGAKRKDISVEDVEVPTKKDDLIHWLNHNCVHVNEIKDVTSAKD